jgi:hypothetical protein
VSRIDFAVDIKKPIDWFHDRAFAKFKAIASDYRADRKRGGLQGFYLGSGNELFAIYDKAYEITARRTYRLVEPEFLGSLSRLELRQRAGKVKHKEFMGLSLYISERVFKNLSFFEIQPRTPKEEWKADRLREKMKGIGFQNAKLALSKDGNFSKTYGPILVRHPLSDEIDEINRGDLARFFATEDKEAAPNEGQADLPLENQNEKP